MTEVTLRLVVYFAWMLYQDSLLIAQSLLKQQRLECSNDCTNLTNVVSLQMQLQTQLESLIEERDKCENEVREV